MELVRHIDLSRPRPSTSGWGALLAVTVAVGACGAPGAPDASAEASTPDAVASDAAVLDAAVLDAAASDAAMVDAAMVDAAEAPAITVDNLGDDDAVPYDLALLRGAVRTPATTLRVRLGEQVREFPVVGGRYKAVVLLRPGTNDVSLAAGDAARTLRLRYEPPTNPRFVRVVYLVAADGDGRFDAPPGEPNDVESARSRLRTAARLMQTFVAETLRAEGFGRRTFRLARDAAHEPVVEVLRSRLTTARARAMSGNELWSYFYGELGTLPDRDASIDVAVMSMTHWDPATRRALAHTALGGGRLGLFGSGTLHTYAASVDELLARWSDARRIDTATLFDDSAGRRTYWANYATGLGATLHELGHCLSLPHPANRVGIMSRQFDHINRTFMTTEPPSANSAGLEPVTPGDEVGWDRSAAVRLGFHRWTALADVPYAHDVAPEFVTTDDALTVEGVSGLRHVAYHVDGNVAGHDEFLGDMPPRTHRTPLATLRARFPSAAVLRATAIDDDGNIGERDVPLR